MFGLSLNPMCSSRKLWSLVLLGSVLAMAPQFALAKGKTAKKADTAVDDKPIDYSYICWPNPPAVARVVYQAFYTGQKRSQVVLKGKAKTKETWMDRLAGTQPDSERTVGVRYLLNQPYGVAVDSKGIIYAADQKVGAIFMFNPETREAELIKNRVDAHLAHVIALATDDTDRLFVADPVLKHILVFNSQHKVEEVITEGLSSPGGIAIDNENRLIYISDVALDQILVYDADTFKLKRAIGTTGHHHELTGPGDLAKPTGVAVDQDGLLYVCDTMNDRIEVFDAEGNFVRAWGKNGDGPGAFARPKGVAIDSDGNVWVADGMLDRLQVFTKTGQLAIIIGGHGLLPGQFQGLVAVASDRKNNRIVTSEIYPGRVQQFRYVTEAEAAADKKRKEEQRATKATEREKAAHPETATPAPATPAPVPVPPAPGAVTK